MEFSSADRHGDAEFTASLKDYNANVQDYNRVRTENIGTIGDQDLSQRGLATAGVLAGALEDGAAHVAAVTQGVAIAQKVQGLRTAGKTAAAEGTELAEIGSDGKAVAKVGEDGLEVAGEVASKGGGLLKGLGVLGAVGSITMDAVKDSGGGWHKMSTADKISNVSDITGSALDVVGLGLEATGFGAPIGLGLQALGTFLQIGSSIENQASNAEAGAAAKKAADAEAAAKVAAQGAAETGAGSQASLAQSGGLSVGRTSQF
tara:strand:+ start:959 stop:1741 length:783 start_codon:yes stop_codon:yes gene_type:complete